MSQKQIWTLQTIIVKNLSQIKKLIFLIFLTRLITNNTIN